MTDLRNTFYSTPAALPDLSDPAMLRVVAYGLVTARVEAETRYVDALAELGFDVSNGDAYEFDHDRDFAAIIGELDTGRADVIDDEYDFDEDPEGLLDDPVSVEDAYLPPRFVVGQKVGPDDLAYLPERTVLATDGYLPYAEFDGAWRVASLNGPDSWSNLDEHAMKVRAGQNDLVILRLGGIA